ncbi:MAG: hypothetical protein HY843_02880 [Bdellovibrio sp.]|nr:hypothetical protein [Bdellovibrio sp.]
MSILAALMFISTASYADEKLYIAVGTARTKRSIVALPEIKSNLALQSNVSIVQAKQTIHKTINLDLDFMDLFRFLSPAAFIEDPKSTGIVLDSFKFSDWSSVGAEFLIKTELNLDGNTLTFQGHLYDVLGQKQIFAKKYLAALSDAKTLAHSFANDIMFFLTGKPGIFLTKIAMSCDLTGKKEIYIMDFDGGGIKQIT